MQVLVNGLIISLAPLFNIHHRLMPLHTRAETIQQDVKDFVIFSRLFVLIAITLFRAVPSKFLGNALHSIFFERFYKVSKCNFITSIQVPMQPSDSSLYDFGFLSDLCDLSPVSVDFESLVIKVSRDLFNGSNIEA